MRAIIDDALSLCWLAAKVCFFVLTWFVVAASMPLFVICGMLGESFRSSASGRCELLKICLIVGAASGSLLLPLLYNGATWWRPLDQPLVMPLATGAIVGLMAGLAAAWVLQHLCWRDETCS